MSWACGFPRFWRAAFPLMKRQRAESLAERELSLLPLIGHRRAEDLGGRVQVEFNLVAGSELVRPWSLWSGWPREGQSLGEAQRELEQHASPLIHPLSQQFRRDPRVREPSVQPVSLAEERCGVRVDLRDLARRIVAALLIAASRHRREKGGSFGPPSIQCAGIAAAILCRSVFIECGPVHWRLEIRNLEFVRRQAAELNRQFRAVLEEHIEWYCGGAGLDWHKSRAAVWSDRLWPQNLLALLLLAGKRPSPQLQPCPKLFDSAFEEWFVCKRPCGDSLEEFHNSSRSASRRASQRKAWRNHRRLGCLEFAIGPGWPYPWLKIPRFGPDLPKLEWSGGLFVSHRRGPGFWDTSNNLLKEWAECSFDQSVEVSVI